MAEKEQEASIKATVVETDEPTFKPEKVVQIKAVLEPEEVEDSTFWPPDYIEWWKDIIPPYIPSYGELPEFEAPRKELIINIETTGAKPWERKLICIGIMDPNELAPVALNFLEETEEKTLDAFLEWFMETEYKVLIGYNVAFDYRFLYVLMQKYRKSVPRWKGLELHDLMQQQKQVKQAYVFNQNPSGKLEDWASYLLGIPPYAEQEQVLAWYKEKNIEEITNFNSDKIAKAYFLWVLDKLVDGAIPGAEVVGRPGAPETEVPSSSVIGSSASEEELLTVQCPKCMQQQTMKKSDKVINCFVCGTPIANPTL